ncbi:MAG TPA: hypothetical protein VHZ32_08440 [Rhizomicrobium sp.]|jgi:hypothetical protein|nr:hypothetical protein [Rhizomicrobium sp.]
MKPTLAFALLLAATLPATAQVQPACGVGQTCPAGSNQVPFPVVNPVQGLANILNLTQHNNPQPRQPMSANGLAPIATPPPVLPPGTSP